MKWGISKEQNMALAENLGLEVRTERLKMRLCMSGTHNVKTSPVHYLVLKVCLTAHKEQEAEAASS